MKPLKTHVIQGVVETWYRRDTNTFITQRWRTGGGTCGPATYARGDQTTAEQAHAEAVHKAGGALPSLKATKKLQLILRLGTCLCDWHQLEHVVVRGRVYAHKQVLAQMQAKARDMLNSTGDARPDQCEARALLAFISQPIVKPG